MPLIYMTPYPGQDKSLDAERFLRLLGVTGKLTGFYYAVYMIEQVQKQPENMILLTKRLYVQTAKRFNTTTNCVERNLRTLVQNCWVVSDRSLLNLIAGAELKQAPTNSQFIDMMAAYLRTCLTRKGGVRSPFSFALCGKCGSKSKNHLNIHRRQVQAVLLEQKCVQATKSPPGMLAHFQGLCGSMSAFLPIKTVFALINGWSPINQSIHIEAAPA